MYKQCIACGRKFSKERFYVLEPFGYRRFWRHFFLELKRCVCGVLISVEHDSKLFDPKWLRMALPPPQIAVREEKESVR